MKKFLKNLEFLDEIFNKWAVLLSLFVCVIAYMIGGFETIKMIGITICICIFIVILGTPSIDDDDDL